MKDTNTVGKKMTRNGPTRPFINSLSFPNSLYLYRYVFNLQSDEYIGLEHSPEDNEKDELSESSESESEDEIEDLGSDLLF